VIVVLSLSYVYFIPSFDGTTLFVGVMVPLAVGSLIFVMAKQRVLLFAFLAYFWSLVDDKPVQFDSVLTWPEVTRFHPAGPHIFMEVVLHLLTLVFLCLVIRECLKGTSLTPSKFVAVFLLTAVAFALSYAQNIPVDAIQNLANQDWFTLDLVEHLISFVFLILACWVAAKLPSAPRTQALRSAPREDHQP
jgi:hypothetical protein